MTKFYEVIEHTADIGIRVKGDDLKALFKNAALAMFDIIASKENLKSVPTESLKIRQEADNLEELFINWLNELLSLSATKELIFCDFDFKKLDNNNLEAVAMGERSKHYKVDVEIKAATHHQLKIEKAKSHFMAEVIFDV